MIESFLQVSCDGCGNTEQGGESNQTRANLALDLRDRGWLVVRRLHYCPDCVRIKAHVGHQSIFDGTKPD